MRTLLFLSLLAVTLFTACDPDGGATIGSDVITTEERNLTGLWAPLAAAAISSFAANRRRR